MPRSPHGRGASKPQGGATVPPGKGGSHQDTGKGARHISRTWLWGTRRHPQTPACTPVPVSMPGCRAHLDLGSGYQGGGTVPFAKTHRAHSLALHTPWVWFCQGPFLLLCGVRVRHPLQPGLNMAIWKKEVSLLTPPRCEDRVPDHC